MNWYIPKPKANKECGHLNPTKPVYGPTPFRAWEYEKRIQYAVEDASQKVVKNWKIHTESSRKIPIPSTKSMTYV